MEKRGWSHIEAEARGAFAGKGRFTIRAYSEFMPPPYVGIKPYAPARAMGACTAAATDETSLDITEYEHAQEIAPGIARIAEHLVFELGKLLAAGAHALSRTLLEGNPAWPANLAEAARHGRTKDDPVLLALPLALSRTQDDKGNARWTLFGASHEGAAKPFFRSFDGDEERFDRMMRWAGAKDVRIFADASEVPRALERRLLGGTHIGSVHTLVTFRPFATLPAAVQEAYLARKLVLFPSPASLVFFEHPLYKRLARALAHATQIPLLRLFPRVEGSCTIRIPQSGWLDEHDPNQVSHVVRTHRWQRIARDAEVHGDGAFTDKVTVALFSTEPDELDLYGKPMARNAQIWTRDYELLLDGPNAKKADIDRAARVTDAGGRFGYRFLFPAMRAGTRELFWHLPLIARRHPSGDHAVVFAEDPPLGYVTAESCDRHARAPHITLAPRLLARPGHKEAATLFPRDPGRARFTTTNNVRKLLEAKDLLGAPMSPAFARALLHVSKETSLEDWLAHLPDAASHRDGGARALALLKAAIGAEVDPGAPRTIGRTATRDFEEAVWRSIAGLAEGEFRQKENADGITVNHGKSGGPAAKAIRLEVKERRDLERLGDHLHERYRALVEKHGMRGGAESDRPEVVDHVFTWETDFDYPWQLGWAKNQTKETHERNVVFVIPGKNRGEAVIMGDHYDTAYMEDVYEPDRGGDGLRAPAAGADDNHSATTALLQAADVLLPLSKAGKLERDVWLVHLTGEEFPGDSLGARALAEAIVEERLAFTTEDGHARDVSHVRIRGVYVLDMIGHNTEKDRDVFQIAPGEGRDSLRLALFAHQATERWNRVAAEKNHAPDRHGKGRAKRMPDGREPPPPFAHLALSGEVRTEWEPRSALYNTDGQVFSDVGIPVVLFMENYDISRTGYHDTHDTMANIDLDYCAALTAIAIEAVTEAACTEL